MANKGTKSIMVLNAAARINSRLLYSTQCTASVVFSRAHFALHACAVPSTDGARCCQEYLRTVSRAVQSGVLDLSGIGLEAFPPDVGVLSALTRLKMTDNVRPLSCCTLAL
eukprot:2665377-Rhodomonas_salina.3